MSPPSLRFAAIANLQQPRCVLRSKYPFPQIRKSTQKIDDRVGTISGHCEFFCYGERCGASGDRIGMEDDRRGRSSQNPQKMGTRPGMEGAPMFSSMVCWVCES